MKKEFKEWIDSATYEDMLKRNRFSKSDDKIFHGDSGQYFINVMREKKKEIGDCEAVRISKKIGWN